MMELRDSGWNEVLRDDFLSRLSEFGAGRSLLSLIIIKDVRCGGHQESRIMASGTFVSAKIDKASHLKLILLVRDTGPRD